MKGGIDLSFKTIALDYFADCPNLVDKINAGFFTKNHVVEIVKFYNDQCVN